VEERERERQRDEESDGSRQLPLSGEQRLERLRERASTRAGLASRRQAGLREEEEGAAAARHGAEDEENGRRREGGGLGQSGGVDSAEGKSEKVKVRVFTV
jgi:hypothetical protein